MCAPQHFLHCEQLVKSSFLSPHTLWTFTCTVKQRNETMNLVGSGLIKLCYVLPLDINLTMEGKGGWRRYKKWAGLGNMWHKFANILNTEMPLWTPVSLPPHPPSSPLLKCLASRARAGKSRLSHCSHALGYKYEDKTRGIGRKRGVQIFTRAPCGQGDKQMCSPGQYITGKCRHSLDSSVLKHSSSRGRLVKRIKGEYLSYGPVQILELQSTQRNLVLGNSLMDPIVWILF